MTDYDLDLFTIGAGSGGVRASRLASQLGKRVAVAEEYREGGTCVIRGCVPKKLFVYASHYAEEYEDANAFGWAATRPDFDWSKLVANKDKTIGRLSGVYRRNLNAAGVEVFNERAIIKDPHTVHLVTSGRDVTAETILVATGSRPYLPESVIGIENAVTSDEMFHLEELPKRLVIVGGGYIAVEFAGIMNGLGVDVTLLYRGAEILRGFDLDLRTNLHRQMIEKGIKIRIESDVKCIEKEGDGYLVILQNEGEIETDLVMYAAGRRPNTMDLGLETADVKLNAIGAVTVDKYSRTSCESIYAIGDVTDRMNLTPVAIREGIAFVETVYKDNPTAMDYDNIPTAVFSQPPIGTVGLTEEEARMDGFKIDIFKTYFRTLKNSFADREEFMLMKLIVDAESDRVLGAHIIGPEAGEMIQMVGIAVKMGATKAQFDSTVAVHPTAAEEIVTMREKYVPEEIEVHRPGRS